MHKHTHKFKQLLHIVGVVMFKVHYRALTCLCLLRSITARVVLTGQEGLAAQLTSVAAAASPAGMSDHRATDPATRTQFDQSPGYSSEPATGSWFCVFISCDVPCVSFFSSLYFSSSPLPGFGSCVLRCGDAAAGRDRENKTVVKLRRQIESNSSRIVA